MNRTIVLLSSLVGFGSSALSQVFTPACPLPLQAGQLQVTQPIDKSCPIAEGSEPDAPHKIQNRVKNNFCATGPAIDITSQILVQLQTLAAARLTAAHQQFGTHDHLPADRSVLKSIPIGNQTFGEGKMVRIKSFILEARHSNVDTGESVNCGKHGADNNDVHIELVDNLSNQKCSSVTAEMTPHFRSPQWSSLAGTGNVTKRTKPLGAKFVRITGQLFFDASHTPAVCGSTIADQQRASSWEIHPVYAIDVCKLPNQSSCEITDDSHWTPLHQFPH